MASIYLQYRPHTRARYQSVYIEWNESKLFTEALQETVKTLYLSLDHLEDALVGTKGSNFFKASELSGKTVEEVLDALEGHTTLSFTASNKKPADHVDEEKSRVQILDTAIHGCLVSFPTELFDPHDPEFREKIDIKSPLFIKDRLIRQDANIRVQRACKYFGSFNAAQVGKTYLVISEGVTKNSYARYVYDMLGGNNIKNFVRVGYPEIDFDDIHHTASDTTGPCAGFATYKDPATEKHPERVEEVTECTLPVTDASPVVPIAWFQGIDPKNGQDKMRWFRIHVYKLTEDRLVSFSCRSGSKRSTDQVLRVLMLDYREEIFDKSPEERDSNILYLINYIRLHRNIILTHDQIVASYQFAQAYDVYERTLTETQRKNRTKLPIKFDEIKTTVDAALANPNTCEIICNDGLMGYRINLLNPKQKLVLRIPTTLDISAPSTTAYIKPAAAPSSAPPFSFFTPLTAAYQWLSQPSSFSSTASVAVYNPFLSENQKVDTNLASHPNSENKASGTESLVSTFSMFTESTLSTSSTPSTQDNNQSLSSTPSLRKRKTEHDYSGT